MSALAVAIVGNLCLLGYFKYRNFFLQSFGDVLSIHFTPARLVVPLGISFHTFQQIAMLVDLRGARPSSSRAAAALPRAAHISRLRRTRSAKSMARMRPRLQLTKGARTRVPDLASEGPGRARPSAGRGRPIFARGEAAKIGHVHAADALAGRLCLNHRIDKASDPFFGRTGELLALSQVEQSLKYELLIPIYSQERPTACMIDHFGETWRRRRSQALARFGTQRLEPVMAK